MAKELHLGASKPDSVEVVLEHFNALSEDDKKTAWRRVRDAANKNAAIREEMVEKAILGGLAPSILKGLWE